MYTAQRILPDFNCVGCGLAKLARQVVQNMANGNMERTKCRWLGCMY